MPDTKDDLLYNSLYMNFEKRQKYSDRKQNSGFKDLGERKGLTTEEQKGTFPGNEIPYVIISITVRIGKISANSTS